MPIFALSESIDFPPAHLTDESGVLAVGGDFQPDRLIKAYRNGIFPWPHKGYPLLWFCPKERFVLSPHDIHIGRTLKKSMKRNLFEISFDQQFENVMRECQKKSRPFQDGTWITDEMIVGYSKLHELGLAHSVEVKDKGNLVGGLYGVSLGHAFFGESMFSNESESSKIGFATLTAHLIKWGFQVIDCQSQTEHLKYFGARLIPRDHFLNILKKSLEKETLKGKWQCSMDSKAALEYLASL